MKETSHHRDTLRAHIDIPFACEEHARIAYNTLTVDSEPRRQLIRKTLALDKSTLSVDWTAKESRILRVSINHFLENLHSVIETIQLFDTAR
jgi:EKC/KEOPS complex subunit PCC1/LAGE3